MREKKAWKKGIDQVELQMALENRNREKEVEAQKAAMPNDSLFTVAKKAGKGLKQKREKLKKDRFKRKEQLVTSKYEEVLVKKIMEKPAAPSAPKKKSGEEEEFGDLWAEPAPKVGKNTAKFMNFLDKTVTKVNPIVLPLAGQSYNPSGKDHKEVIDKVIAEEMKDVVEVQRQLRTLKPHMFSEGQQPKPTIKEGIIKKDEPSSDSDEDEDVDSDESNEIGEERTNNKPVDRNKKLTKTERNFKLIKRLRNAAQEEQRKDKLWNKAFNKLPQFIKDHDEKQTKIELEKQKREQEKVEERAKQESTGVVAKPSILGRYRYKMRKTDFQTEEELAGSLRTIRSKATPADLLVDRYDSVFRRNLVEPEAPIGGDRKRNRKAKYKWHNSKGGTGAEKLDQKNKKIKQEMEAKHNIGATMLKNDIILI